MIVPPTWGAEGSRLLDVGDAGVVRGPGSGGGPQERPLLDADRHVIDTRLAAAHQAPLVKLPQLVAVTAEPVAAGVVPLVPEPDRDAILGERPERLDQAVIEFLRPFAGEEGPDLV